MNRKKVYNPESTEKIDQAMVFGGSPSGIINSTKPTNKKALELYIGMLNNTWFPEEADTSRDKVPYASLSEYEKRMFDLALAQLIFNDSEQTNNLMDNINPYVTDPIYNVCLARQAFEEGLHSFSYGVMVEDLSVNTDAIYEMYKTDPVLREKNDAIANMYAELADDPSEEEKALALVANNILEGIPFFGGFAAIWSLGHKMLGSATMVKFIARDENGTHLPLFGMMFQDNLKQRPYLNTEQLRSKIYDKVDKFVNLEIKWTKYITGGNILGFSDSSIERYIQYRGDVVLDNLGYERRYFPEYSPLIDLEKKYIDFNAHRTNFFEGNVTNYSKGGLDMSF